MSGLLIILGGCGGKSSSTPTINTADESIFFNDISSQTQMDFQYGYKNAGTEAEVQKMCGGIAVGDIDNDGLADVFIVRGDIGSHILYKNMGNNRFEDITDSVGLTVDGHLGCGPAIADIDGDYDLDIFVGGIEGDRSYLWQNQLSDDGALGFTDITQSSGLADISARNTISASLGDYNNDGLLDLFLTHWGTSREVAKQHLWRNIGNAQFENATEDSGIGEFIFSGELINPVMGENTDYTFTATFTDINQDSFADLLVVGDFGSTKFFINDGDGTFTHATSSVIKDENGMGSAVGDYDNDGDLDWFVSAIYSVESPGNRLYKNMTNENMGGEIFSDVTTSANVEDGGWGWAACFADFNNDSFLDIFHVNGWDASTPGFDYRDDHSRLYMSQGKTPGTNNVTFVEESRSLGIFDRNQGRAAVCFDSDNDGDLDILVLNNDDRDFIFYRNNASTKGNYLTVALRGNELNTQAYGARVFVRTGTTEQMRELILGNHFTSQGSVDQFFGLGQATQVNQVRVEWADGRITTLDGVGVNQRLLISHPELN